MDLSAVHVKQGGWRRLATQKADATGGVGGSGTHDRSLGGHKARIWLEEASMIRYRTMFDVKHFEVCSRRRPCVSWVPDCGIAFNDSRETFSAPRLAQAADRRRLPYEQRLAPLVWPMGAAHGR